MAQFDNRYRSAGDPARAPAPRVDEGLRSYMLGVYNYMAAGVALTGITAYLSQHARRSAPAASCLTPFGVALYQSPLKWVVMLAPLGVRALPLASASSKMSVGAAQIAFWVVRRRHGRVAVVDLPGLHRPVDHAGVLRDGGHLRRASASGATRRSATSRGWGSFLFMGVIGIIIAALVNIFLQSSALQFAISVVGVLVFAGLTAYDTQRIKDGYFDGARRRRGDGARAPSWAPSLYLDFINMFMMLLNLFGNRN